jgi:predicted nucleic acid-binding protein
MRFVDSNIWLYAMIQSSDPERRAKAIAAIQQPDLVVSTQVVNEVCYNLIRKACFDSSRISQVIEAFYNRALVLPVDRISMESSSPA